MKEKCALFVDRCYFIFKNVRENNGKEGDVCCDFENQTIVIGW